MTVLGDFNQAIFAHASETVNFDTLTNLYGPDETNGINLTRSYRSTKPIIEFTRALVPEGKNIHAFERDGAKPTVTKVANHNKLHEHITAKVAALQTEQHNTIAIICKSAAESAAAYEELSSIEDIKLVKSTSAEYEQGIVVIPAYLAKVSNLMPLLFTMLLKMCTAMRAFVDCSTLLVRERCMNCTFIVLARLVLLYLGLIRIVLSLLQHLDNNQGVFFYAGLTPLK